MTDQIPCSEPPSTCSHVQNAADHSVKRVFAIMGVDVDDPKQVEEFRQDLRFGATLRKAANHGWLAFIAVFAAGAGWAMWLGIVSKFKGA